MIERIKMIIYIEKCRERESRKDAESEIDKETMCVSLSLTPRAHTDEQIQHYF